MLLLCVIPREILGRDKRRALRTDDCSRRLERRETCAACTARIRTVSEFVCYFIPFPAVLYTFRGRN